MTGRVVSELHLSLSLSLMDNGKLRLTSLVQIIQTVLTWAGLGWTTFRVDRPFTVTQSEHSQVIAVIIFIVAFYWRIKISLPTITTPY